MKEFIIGAVLPIAFFVLIAFAVFMLVRTESREDPKVESAIYDLVIERETCLMLMERLSDRINILTAKRRRLARSRNVDYTSIEEYTAQIDCLLGVCGELRMTAYENGWRLDRKWEK